MRTDPLHNRIAGRAVWPVLVLGLLAGALLGLGLGGVGGARAALPSTLADGQPMPSLAPMLKAVSPSVVNIATYTTEANSPLLKDPFFRRFFNYQPRRRTQAAGSGVVVDARRGYVITNHHVVASSDEITVGLSDGRTLQAELVGQDPKVDLAVLKVDGEDLVELPFADSSAVAVGDFVVAIGNPFGFNQTVTSGIVSALGRSGLRDELYENYIQTDASINPGNSGGALVDLQGRLVGVNTAIFAPSGGNIGIGFAIPANMVRSIMEELIDHGRVRRGYVGLDVQPLNVELARAFGVNQRDGVVVVSVQPGGAADEAGLEPGDIITRVGRRDVMQVSDFQSQTAVMVVGDKVPLEIVRDGRRKKVTLRIADISESQVPGTRFDRRLEGVTLQNFVAQGEALEDSLGVLVATVTPDSPAWRYGLRAGDVLVGLNRQAVRSLADFAESSRQGSQLLLRVFRNGEYGYITIR